MDAFAGTGNIVSTLTHKSLRVVSNDANPQHGAQFAEDAGQVWFWKKLGERVGAAPAVVTSPWFELLDLVIPLMVRVSPIVVCVHVPYGYVTAAPEARHKYFRGLAEEGRLFMVVGLSRYAALRSCAWLCVFKDWQTRDQLVRTDMESEVGWFRMSHRLPAVVDNAAAAGASGAGGGAAHAGLGAS